MKNISQDEAYAGMKWLINNYYSPKVFRERLCNMLEHFGSVDPSFLQHNEPPREIATEAYLMTQAVVKEMREGNEEERGIWTHVENILKQRPELSRVAAATLLFYKQVRFMYENTEGFWDQTLVGRPLVL